MVLLIAVDGVTKQHIIPLPFPLPLATNTPPSPPPRPAPILEKKVCLTPSVTKSQRSSLFALHIHQAVLWLARLPVIFASLISTSLVDLERLLVICMRFNKHLVLLLLLLGTEALVMMPHDVNFSMLDVP